jgi:hypothetical protein
VVEMCGTSITQIENTYYHTTEEKMVSNALSGYYVKDGLLIAKYKIIVIAISNQSYSKWK